MNKQETIAYLTRCADDNGDHWYEGRVWSDPATCPTCHGTNDAGWLRTPCSRYGHTSAEVAAVVWKHCQVTSRDGQSTDLDYSMGLAVNDSDVLEDDLRRYAIGLSGANIDAIVKGYLDAQLSIQTDYDHGADGHYDLLEKHYDRDDISDGYVEPLHDEIAALVAAHPLAVRMYLHARSDRRRRAAGFEHVDTVIASESFGYDYYLTREGHGAGFWDRGLGDLGDHLTQIAKWAGSAEELTDNGDGVLV